MINSLTLNKPRMQSSELRHACLLCLAHLHGKHDLVNNYTCKVLLFGPVLGSCENNGQYNTCTNATQCNTTQCNALQYSTMCGCRKYPYSYHRKVFWFRPSHPLGICVPGGFLRIPPPPPTVPWNLQSFETCISKPPRKF